MNEYAVERLLKALQSLTNEIQLFREAYVANNFPNSYAPKTEPQTDCYVSDLCKHYGDKQICGRCRNRNLFCEAEPQPRCPKCGKRGYIRSLESMGVKLKVFDEYKWKCTNCNKYFKEEPTDESQTDCGDFADRLAYERGVKHAWEVAQKVFNSTVTFYEAEDVAKQIDKDINVRSKDEPQTNKDFKVTYTCSFTECDNFKNFGFGEKCIECKRKQSEAKHKTEPQYDFGEYADRLWKIAYERGKREALEQTEREGE